MADQLQKDWLNINKMCRDLTWLLYGDDYKDYPELKEALEKLKIARDKIKKKIENK